jgi:hypothetical protein
MVLCLELAYLRHTESNPPEMPHILEGYTISNLQKILWQSKVLWSYHGNDSPFAHGARKILSKVLSEDTETDAFVIHQEPTLPTSEMDLDYLNQAMSGYGVGLQPCSNTGGILTIVARARLPRGQPGRRSAAPDFFSVSASTSA